MTLPYPAFTRMSLDALVLAQRSIDDLGHKGTARLLRQSVTQTAIDERHLKAFDAIVGDVGHQLYIVDIKLAIGFPLRIHFAEELDLILVKVLAYLLYRPDVTEEFGPEITIRTTVSLIMLR